MYYLVRYGEIGLKGLNRPFFENKLISNIKRQTGAEKIRKTRGRIIIKSDEDISEKLKKVFGIVSFSAAEKVEFSKLYDFVLNLLSEKTFKTFRITTNRVSKDFPKTSEEINKELGALVVEKLNKKVDLENQDLNIQIELIDSAYIFFDKVRCAGGLPVSTEGKVIVLIETEKGIDAAKGVMKRGCDVIPAAFKQFDIDEINSYLPDKKELAVIKDLKEIDTIAEKEDAKALVVEDSFDNLKDYDTKLTVLRPVAFN